MSYFTLVIHSPSQGQVLDDIVSFTGQDASGRFTIYAFHIQMVTVLSYGLHWFKTGSGSLRYLALPSSALRFECNELVIDSLYYLLSESSEGMLQEMERLDQQAKSRRRRFTYNIHQLERSFIKQLKNL